MKILLKTLKRIGITLLVLVVGFVITVSLRQNLTYEAPYPDIKASKDSSVIAHGKDLALGPAHCASCHSTANADSLIALGQEVPLSGGFEFKIPPVATIYSPNITSDSTHGIGKRTDGEIARALRYGVRADGTAMFDFMPFHNVSDEDLTAIVSYVRSLKPVNKPRKQHEIEPMGRIIKAFMVEPVWPSEKIQKSVKVDTTAEYGRYLAHNVANCVGCHTRRGLAGGYTGEQFAGGNKMGELITPNITPDSSSRIYGWSEEAFIARLKGGKVIPQSEMPWNSFKRMNDNQLKAIYRYLQTVKPAKMPKEG
ncbi:c-type cytochrome [Emticicia sp. BO119]|uniref:c-type cytochrome n=1 Tax=Emticicia sp. BO119 TaxID=2757768 RepID=UPI0015F01954|nr:c-type cytochrome [Emticicia sp. BO119]MBA4850367.1 c-type cytochrome [Emticicia sp. BO119]